MSDDRPFTHRIELTMGDVCTANWLGDGPAVYLRREGRLHVFAKPSGRQIFIRNESVISSIRNGLTVSRAGKQIWPDAETLSHRARLFMHGCQMPPEEIDRLSDLLGSDLGRVIFEAKAEGCRTPDEILVYALSVVSLA